VCDAPVQADRCVGLEELRASLSLLTAEHEAALQALKDYGREKEELIMLQRATVNLLEDMDAERNKSFETQRALLNMLEDIEEERAKVEQTKSVLEAVNKELEGFSYSVSHDLRAPLRAISGFSQAIMEDCGSQLDAEGLRHLGLIQDNAHRMGQLIDDLLSFSRVGRQHMTGTHIDMTELARTVFTEIIAQEPRPPHQCHRQKGPSRHGETLQWCGRP